MSKEYIIDRANIASFAFSLLSNNPGALLEALNFIAEFGFNMSKIESRPSKRELGEYIIFVDVEINTKTNIEAFNKLKKKIKPLCEHLIDFGCYLSQKINLD